MKILHNMVKIVVLLLSLSLVIVCSHQLPDRTGSQTRQLSSELISLDDDEMQFLLEQISLIEPPQRMKDISRFGSRQAELGGGFFGMLPDSLSDEAQIPVPVNKAEKLQAASLLAKHRRAVFNWLRENNADYEIYFSGEKIPGQNEEYVGNLRLILDFSVLEKFLEALSDSEISLREAGEIVDLPANVAMLNHRNSLGYMPEPRVTQETLKTMIIKAGSPDPLDKLWNWTNPMNNFGYADVVHQEKQYRDFLDKLRNGSDRLIGLSLKNVGLYSPIGFESTETFAFTVGFFIRGWATSSMAGLNIEQVKDNWDYIIGTMIEETFHRLQLKLCSTVSGKPAAGYDDLVIAGLKDDRYNKFYEMLTYAVLEGSANLARGDYVRKDLTENIAAGFNLVDEFVERVINQGDLDAADELINDGLRNNGPLYSLGWYLAGLIAKNEGTHAVGEQLSEGPVKFIGRANIYISESTASSFSPSVRNELTKLEEMLSVNVE